MGLGDNVVLRLMECLTPTVTFDLFMDNYFTSFCLLTHLGVNYIGAIGGLNKKRLCKCTIIGYKQQEKRNVATLSSAAHIKQKRCVTYVVN